MPKENRNPPKQFTGPQGVATLLADYQEQRDVLNKKLDTIIEQLDEVLALVTPAINVSDADGDETGSATEEPGKGKKTTTKK